MGIKSFIYGAFRLTLFKKIKILKGAGVLTALLITTVSFQNCGKVRMTEDASSLVSDLSAQDRQTDVQFKDILIPVDVNQTKVIDLIEDKKFAGIVSLNDSSLLATKIFDKQGTVTLNENKLSQITFEPVFGYRGSLTLPVYIKYNDFKVEVIKLTFQVQNPLRDFKPSLVARAAECMLCHANIKGDLISDFGFKGILDPKGPDLFFRTNPNGAHLGTGYSTDHGAGVVSQTGWGTVKVAGKLIIPSAILPLASDPVGRKYSISPDYTENSVTKTAKSLFEYLDKIMFVDKTRVTEIQERKSIYIGAPTADEIRSSGHLTSAKALNFIKNDNDKPGLSGFERVTADGKDYYTNTGIVECNGDLFVDGVVFLNNLNLRTEFGCRIHATKTVFIQGPIEYLDEYALSNLQIMSAKAIYMGSGMCFDCHNDGAVRDNYNFLVARAGNLAFWLGSLRNQLDLTNYASEIQEDFLKVSNESQIAKPAEGVNKAEYYAAKFKEGGVKLLDANNPFNNTSDTAYRRLLLNAPDVQSRYNGKFQGTIIAEFALWKLGGKFAFQYDSVFTAVPIFPLMDLNKILVIKD